jgi:hypothetical protein
MYYISNNYMDLSPGISICNFDVSFNLKLKKQITDIASLFADI